MFIQATVFCFLIPLKTHSKLISQSFISTTFVVNVRLKTTYYISYFVHSTAWMNLDHFCNCLIKASETYRRRVNLLHLFLNSASQQAGFPGKYISVFIFVDVHVYQEYVWMERFDPGDSLIFLFDRITGIGRLFAGFSLVCCIKPRTKQIQFRSIFQYWQIFRHKLWSIITSF